MTITALKVEPIVPEMPALRLLPPWWSNSSSFNTTTQLCLSFLIKFGVQGYIQLSRGQL
jgi:hypothetical protein